jgi:toxin YoeB
MRSLVFEADAQEVLFYWAKADLKILRKIIDLLEDTQSHPFSGKGKPEGLKHNLKGFWAKRINDEHRMVYKVTDDEIIVIQCRFHYSEK